jgi:NAD+ diphosphatase
VSAAAWSFAFAGRCLLLKSTADGASVPTSEEVADLLHALGPGTAQVDVELPALNGKGSQLHTLPDDFEAPEGFELTELRASHALLAEPFFRTAGTARQQIDWIQTHRFCSRCGAPTERHTSHAAMVCPDCGQLHFPRLAPAVIVLIQRGREALLARSPHFTPEVYSTIAGFVEPGESLEECVHREINEEVGVRVTHLRYFGSQPHPFPHSLMVGFIVDWESGDIRVDTEELEDARWFTPETMPDLPHRMSIARALIEDFIERVES